MDFRNHIGYFMVYQRQNTSVRRVEERLRLSYKIHPPDPLPLVREGGVKVREGEKGEGYLINNPKGTSL